MNVSEKLDTILALMQEVSWDLDDAGSVGESPEETIVLFHRLKGESAALFKKYEAAFIQQVETTPVPLETLAGDQVEIKRGSGRKGWRHAELMDEAIERVLERATDFDTGEVVWDSERCMRELVKLFSPSWRVKALSGIGLDADQYSEKGAESENVSIRRV